MSNILYCIMAISSVDFSSRTYEQGSPRRLFELLEEKQEPFVLDIYLIERGCRRKKSLELDISCCSTNQKSNNASTYHVSDSVRKSTTLGQFSSIAKSLYSKIVLVNGVLKPKHGSNKKKGRRKEREVMEESRCSSDASCSTLSKSWCESDIDGQSISSPGNYKTTHLPDPIRVMGQWRLGEENKQFSPDSVLDEIDLLQDIPVYNVRQNQEAQPPTATRIKPQKKMSEESILSATLWEMLEQARKEKSNKRGSKSFPKYMNSMKALQQSKQLLFDSVREAVETQHNSKQQRIIRRETGLIGSEEIGKIVCSNFTSWGKFSGNKTSVTKLLKTDLLSTNEEEWGNFGEMKREIVKEIEICIFEGIINDIVRDMVDQ